jgi:hypothetical protein
MIHPKTETIAAGSGKYIDYRVIYDYLSKIAGRRINKRRGSRLLEACGIVSDLGRSIICRGEYGKVIVRYRCHALLGCLPDKLVYIPK